MLKSTGKRDNPCATPYFPSDSNPAICHRCVATFASQAHFGSYTHPTTPYFPLAYLQPPPEKHSFKDKSYALAGLYTTFSLFPFLPSLPPHNPPQSLSPPPHPCQPGVLTFHPLVLPEGVARGLCPRSTLLPWGQVFVAAFSGSTFISSSAAASSLHFCYTFRCTPPHTHTPQVAGRW